jgi:isopentenyl diphosphate isomerase/L-lactate dehydrogenase-like FMN-dependent dehydrogenase
LAKTISYNPKYPSIKDLRAKAKRRISKFAFEYLDERCNKNVNLYKNTSELRKVELKPKYLISFSQPNLKTKLFNHQFTVQFFEIINSTNNTLKPIEKQTNNSIFLNFIVLILIIISTIYLINFKNF